MSLLPYASPGTPTYPGVSMLSSLPNMNSARALTSSVLPTPVGPRNRERAYRTPGVFQAGPGPAHRFGYAIDCLVLANDALVYLLFHAKKAFGFFHSQARHRYSRPHAYYFSYILAGDDSPLILLLPVPVLFQGFSIFSTSPSSRSLSSAAYSYCCAAMASSFSFRTFSSTWVTSFTERGVVLVLSRTREEASSTRSMALSG